MSLDKPKDFSLIVHLIKDAQTHAIHTVNAELINLYWSVGGYISAQLTNATWGNKTVDELANFIQKEHPEIKGFNRRGLYRMKQFYETYSSMSFVTVPMPQMQSANNERDRIVSSPMTQLGIADIRDTILTKVSWTHHLVLITRVKTDEEREFYLQLSIREGFYAGAFGTTEFLSGSTRQGR